MFLMQMNNQTVTDLRTFHRAFPILKYLTQHCPLVTELNTCDYVLKPYYF